MPEVNINYIVSSLPDYVKNNAELISKSLAFGTPTIKRLTPQTGIKTSEYINFLGVNVPIQNGRGCGFNANGSVTLTNRTITTAILKKELEICPDTLLGKWAEYDVRIPADQRDHLPFEAFVIAEILNETAEQLEALVWQGKTATHGGTDLIDGFLTILDNESTAIKLNSIDETKKYDAVKAVISAAPAKLIKNLKVFVSPEFFLALSFELLEKNLYHFDVGTPQESLIFPATGVEIIKTEGLAGTNRIVASVLKNMYYGTDVEDAERRVKVVYDEKADTFAIKFRWNSGVQVAFPDWCVVGTLVTPEPAGQNEEGGDPVEA